METFVEVNGGRVYVDASDRPRESCIVVPVAWGASHELYERLLDPLQLSLRLIHFDPEGTGASTPLPAGWTPARILDELEAVRSEILGTAGTLLLGHASGAFMSMAYALESPNAVRGLILISPFASYRRANDLGNARVESHPNWESFREKAAQIRRVPLGESERFRAIFKEQRLIDMYDYGPHYFQMIEAIDEADFNPAMHDDAEIDLLDDIHQIEAPVLIVTGEDDPLSPLEEARLIADELPYVRLIELPNCGHYPFVEQPAAFEQAVADFIAIID